MLRRLSLPAALAVLLFSLQIFTGLNITAHAQDLRGGASRKDLSGGAGSGNSGGGSNPRREPRRPTVRNTAKSTGVRKAERPNPIIIKQTTRTLSVATEPGAAILVEPLSGGEALEAQMEKDERVFVFANLKPGRYRVAAELEGYTESEDEVTVLTNKPASVTLNLQPITYDVTISVNVPEGEVRYAPVAIRKDGSGKYDVTGDTRLVEIKNRRAILPKLRAGTYGIDVRTDVIGFQDELATFTLPGKTEYPVELAKNISTKTFQESWASLNAWDAPANWRVNAGKLATSGAGVAIPRDDSVRHYSDFRLLSLVMMHNDVGASFIIRAADKQNYYLIQITGAKSDEPYVLRGFVVRNGIPQSLGTPTPVAGFADILNKKQFIGVEMNVKDNKIKVCITDEKGDGLPLGIVEDTNRNFMIGAAGIAVRGTEQNEFGTFTLVTSESTDCVLK